MPSAEMRSTEAPFAGLPVGDFPATEPGPEVAIRIHIDWDDEDADFDDLLSKLVAHEGTKELQALVIGAWVAESLDDPSGVLEAWWRRPRRSPNSGPCSSVTPPKKSVRSPGSKVATTPGWPTQRRDR